MEKADNRRRYAYGPHKEPSSTVLSKVEEALIVAFRKHTLLPLDDCLYALQDSIPKLTRSSLLRCLRRHGISRLPETTEGKPAKKKFKPVPIGFFHIGITEDRTEEGKLYLFVGIDRTSKFVMVKLCARATMASSKDFLEELIKAVPNTTHTVLKDNGIQFADTQRNRDGLTPGSGDILLTGYAASTASSTG